MFMVTVHIFENIFSNQTGFNNHFTKLFQILLFGKYKQHTLNGEKNVLGSNQLTYLATLWSSSPHPSIMKFIYHSKRWKWGRVSSRWKFLSLSGWFSTDSIIRSIDSIFNISRLISPFRFWLIIQLPALLEWLQIYSLFQDTGSVLQIHEFCLFTNPFNKNVHSSLNQTFFKCMFNYY